MSFKIVTDSCCDLPAGMIAGLGLTVAMVIVCLVNRGEPIDAYAWSILIALLVQVGLVAVGWLGIEATVFVCFDRKGNRRR